MLLSIAGMFRAPPYARVAAGRQALALPDLPLHLRAQHLVAALFHNLLVGGRTEEARGIRAETAAAVHESGDGNATFALALAETVTAYVEGRYADALELTERARAPASAQPTGRASVSPRSDGARTAPC